MGGQISVESERGQGTTFSVRLPMLMEQGIAIPVTPPQLEGKKILIYEPEARNMELHLKIAEELKMTPLPVNSLEELTPHLDQRFDVILVCDSLTASGTGVVLSRVEMMEGSPLVLLAGYRGRTVGVPAPATRVLMKPFLADDLAEAIIDPKKQYNSLNDPFAEMLGREVKEGSGIQILLAEDNAIAAKVLSTLLLQRGHSVYITKDGKEALEAASKRDFHLAFIDLRMPRMDGIEFTRIYRQSEAEDQHLPIYAMTANTAEDAMENCIAAGMDGFLNKPVEPEQLDAIIERHTGSLYQA
jgi:two-component system sensor histidine kinase RpfC